MSGLGFAVVLGPSSTDPAGTVCTVGLYGPRGGNAPFAVLDARTARHLIDSLTAALAIEGLSNLDALLDDTDHQEATVPASDARTASSARSTSGSLTHDQRATSEAGPAGYARDKARAAARLASQDRAIGEAVNNHPQHP